MHQDPDMQRIETSGNIAMALGMAETHLGLIAAHTQGPIILAVNDANLTRMADLANRAETALAEIWAVLSGQQSDTPIEVTE